MLSLSLDTFRKPNPWRKSRTAWTRRHSRWNKHGDHGDYNPSHQRGFIQGLREHCLGQLFDDPGNQSHSRSHRTFLSFPAKKQRDGTHRQLAYPANAETRMMIQRVILSEDEKIVAGNGSVPTVRSPSERLRALDQLKNDSLINEEEYNAKRKEILGEL